MIYSRDSLQHHPWTIHVQWMSQPDYKKRPRMSPETCDGAKSGRLSRTSKKNLEQKENRKGKIEKLP